LAGGVAGTVLRATLQATRRASGAQYPQLLEQAGLSRYLHTLPPLNEAPACTAVEFSRLPAGVYAMLGEPLTRLFLRNIGALAVPRTLQDPGIQALQANLAALPPEARLAPLVRSIGQIVTRTWAPTTLTEDASAWYLSVGECPTCLSLPPVSAPICANSEAFYAGFASRLMARRMRVVEVVCRATGGPTCTFAFYK